jgi:hypothetical protein
MTGGGDITDEPPAEFWCQSSGVCSSLNTVAHILGMKVAVEDILPVFGDFDGSGRVGTFGVIRNFQIRCCNWRTKADRSAVRDMGKVVCGEEENFWAPRSGVRPIRVVRWRQRDYLARESTDLFGYWSPT